MPPNPGVWLTTTANRKAIDRIPIETPRAAAADPGAPCRWLNRRELRWPFLGWFALGAVPRSVAGGLLLAHVPLKRVLGVFLSAWRTPRPPTEPAFGAVGAASGLGLALLGSVAPLTAPFFLAVGLPGRPTSGPRPPAR